jgi:hypothetical protein
VVCICGKPSIVIASLSIGANIISVAGRVFFREILKVGVIDAKIANDHVKLSTGDGLTFGGGTGGSPSATGSKQTQTDETH